ncbi:hypothetical protein [Candidatus Cyanaurora vandensis]|nr:hypothetical protein [Candidatus Cyanaurora vandensis]
MPAELMTVAVTMLTDTLAQFFHLRHELLACHRFEILVRAGSLGL